MEYIDTVRNPNRGAGIGTGIGTGTGVDATGVLNIAIELDSNKFPIAPRITGRKITKDMIEPLYRMYITQHYRKWIRTIENIQ